MEWDSYRNTLSYISCMNEMKGNVEMWKKRYFVHVLGRQDHRKNAKHILNSINEYRSQSAKIKLFRDSSLQLYKAHSSHPELKLEKTAFQSSSQWEEPTAVNLAGLHPPAIPTRKAVRNSIHLSLPVFPLLLDPSLFLLRRQKFTKGSPSTYWLSPETARAQSSPHQLFVLLLLHSPVTPHLALQWSGLPCTTDPIWHLPFPPLLLSLAGFCHSSTVSPFSTCLHPHTMP